MNNYKAAKQNFSEDTQDSVTTRPLGEAIKYQQMCSRLQIMLKMINHFCKKKLAVLPEMQQLHDYIVKTQQLLKEEKKFTIIELENLLEYCKLYLNENL